MRGCEGSHLLRLNEQNRERQEGHKKKINPGENKNETVQSLTVADDLTA